MRKQGGETPRILMSNASKGIRRGYCVLLVGQFNQGTPFGAVPEKIMGGHRPWSGARKHDILQSALDTSRVRDEGFMRFLEDQYRKSVTS